MNKNQKRVLKKIGLYFLISIITAISISSFYIYLPKTLQSFDSRLRDYMFIIRGEEPDSKSVVIVDLDEKSLASVGQWPWSRDVISDLLINLTNAGVGIIGFDIVFAEEDRSSPIKVLKKLGMEVDDTIPDYDNIFASVVAQTPTILGYQFQMEKDEFIKTDTPSIPAIFIEKNKTDNNDFVIKGEGTILNIPKVQENSYSSGFFNNVPDPSGIIRSVPLIIRYDGQLYPSLALELTRAITGKRKVYVNYNELGVTEVQVGDFNIPTDANGRILVNFRGPEKSFKYISALDILNGDFNQSDIEGKIVLIGTSAAGLLDLRATPFESVYPGVEVHANAIDNILTSNYIFKPPWADGANIIHIFLLSIIIVITLAFVSAIYLPFIIGIVSLVDLIGLYHLLFKEGLVLNIFFPMLTIVVSAVSTLLIIYFFEKKNEEAIKKKFASKVSKEVMESLLQNPDSKEFEAMDKEITVFFSDVRGFTNISEAMPSARALIQFLNEYMTPMSNIIIEEKGTIDKYIGDAIMAYWNAPGSVPDHRDRALSATIRQIEYLVPLNKELKEKGLPLIDIGIGLNTGVATVGEMGSEQRSDYTVIGDPINLGARLESLCKSYGARIIISEFVKDGLEGIYQIRNLDLVRVKGKTEPVEIFEVYSFGKPEGRLKEELDLFNKAVDLYRNSKFGEALEIFKDVNSWEDKRNKKIYDTYIERCEHFIEYPPENFDGVFTHTTKG